MSDYKGTGLTEYEAYQVHKILCAGGREGDHFLNISEYEATTPEERLLNMRKSVAYLREAIRESAHVIMNKLKENLDENNPYDIIKYI